LQQKFQFSNPTSRIFSSKGGGRWLWQKPQNFWSLELHWSLKIGHWDF